LRDHLGMKLFHVEQFGGFVGEMVSGVWRFVAWTVERVRSEDVFWGIYPLLECPMAPFASDHFPGAS
jgi:hypothetical protein